MTGKIATLIAVLAVLFGCALAAEFASGNIKLDVFKSSTPYWIAVAPVNEGGITKKVEMLESSSDDWVEMMPTPSWGYWQMYSTKGEAFKLPLSFRLTSSHGEQVILDNVLTSVKGGDLLETATRFARASHGSDNRESTNHQGNNNNNNDDQSNNGHHSNPAPTQAPTHAPTHTTPTSAPAHSTPTSAPAHSTPTSAPAHSTPTSAPAHSTPTSAPAHSTPTSAPSGHSGSSSTPSSGSSADLCAATPTSSEPVKLLVPLYVDPGSEWDELVTAAESGTPIVAIINPDSGPVSSGPDSSYTTYMNKFKNAGIEMVGYIATGYASKSVADVNAEVDTYASKYSGLKGIFLDEVSAEAGDVSHYQQIYTHILSKTGYTYDIINPGTEPDQGYLNAATNIVVFESPANAWGSFSSWITCAPSAAAKAGYKYKFSAIAFAASQSQMQSLVSQMANSGMGMVFVTDGAEGCCTYNDLASYFATEASAVKAVNG